jgi:hypothetical protein
MESEGRRPFRRCPTTGPIGDLTLVSANHPQQGGLGLGRRLLVLLTQLRSDRALAAGLLALGVGLPVVMGFIASSIGIPRNDDWVYRRIALELAQTGVLALHSVTTMMVGQIVVAQPFLWLSGLQPWGFTAAGIIFAAAAVFCAYILARQFLPPLRAAVATSLLLLFPAYLAYATSFMTDVPATAAQFACLAVGAIALRRRPVSSRWLLAGAAVGCVAISIREFAVAAPASLVLCAICSEPRRWRHWALAVAVAICFGLLYLLKATLPGQDLGARSGIGGLSQSLDALSSLSLVLLPAALIGGLRWHREWKRIDLAVGAEIGLGIVGLRVLQWLLEGEMPQVIMENLASRWGAPAPAYVIGGRPLLFGDSLWALIGIVALAATVIVLSIGTGIAGVHLRRGQGSVKALIGRLGSPTGLLVLFSTGVLVGLATYGLKFPLFDRYYWPLVPVAAILFMNGRESESPSTAPTPLSKRVLAASMTASLVLLAVVSTIFMLNSFAFDSARWHAGERLTLMGINPEEVDAGYEWVGYYQPILPAANDIPPQRTFYEMLWPGRRTCGFVTSRQEEPTDATLVGTVSYSLLLILGPEERLYLYRATGPDCTPE